MALNKTSAYILKTFLSYLPSRFFVVLNSLIIVPVLAQLMTSSEMSIFQLAIGILNLVCTCSTDWIAKSVLRFYEKYNVQNRLEEFFSNTLIITAIVYSIIILGYLCFSDYIVDKFYISKSVLLITLVLVIPVGFRQFLYQMLRILNKPFLYTFSIFLYQVSMLVLFLLMTNVVPKVYSVLFAMMIAIVLIDIYICREIALHFRFKCSYNPDIVVESLKYALPQIVTNTSIWAILHVSQYIFQYSRMDNETSTFIVGFFLVGSALTPILSSLIFAMFPYVIKKFETNNNVKNVMTGMIRFYCFAFLPITLMFCFYSKELSNVFLGGKYPSAFSVICCIALTLFVHELMKIFNMKYHLQVKTYIEMAVSLFVGLLCIGSAIYALPRFGLMAANVIVLFSMCLLFTLNNLVKFKGSHYVSYGKVIKTFVLSFAVCVASVAFVSLMPLPYNEVLFDVLKLVLYIVLSYLLSVVFIKRFLE